MPIEFHCTQCHLRLRTPDDTAGKQARCPNCGTLVPIPLAAEGPEPQTGAADWQAAAVPPHDGAQPNPFADPPPLNPYQTPAGSLSPAIASPAEAKSRMMGPAVGMIVCAVLSILYAVSNLAFTLVMGMEQFVQELPPDPAVRHVFHGRGGPEPADVGGAAADYCRGHSDAAAQVLFHGKAGGHPVFSALRLLLSDQSSFWRLGPDRVERSERSRGLSIEPAFRRT